MGIPAKSSSKGTGKAGLRKYLGLQVLRLVAATMVVITHGILFTTERLDRHFGLWERGGRGVDIFFALSGFVMIYSSTKIMEGCDGWKIFAERRIVRIVPMYWIATSIKVVAVLFTTGYALHAQLSLVNTVFSYVFLPSYSSEGKISPVLGVGWTLNIEMFFYFLFTLALFFRWNVFKFVGAVLGLLAVASFFRQLYWPPAAFYANIMVLEFFYGMVIAKICLSGKHISKYLAIPLLCLGLVCLMAPWSIEPKLDYVLVGLVAAVIVYSMASLEDHMTRIPKWALYMADASYVIYLFHPMIAPAVPVVMMKFHFIHPWFSVVCCVIIALASGCLIHKYVEDPITRWFRAHLLIRGKKFIHPVATV